MKNKSLRITQDWVVNRDEFYEIDPMDDSIDPDTKFMNLFCQENLLSLAKANYHIDLGWYGSDDENGFFSLYLYRGSDWHNCELLEKVQSNNLSEVVKEINAFIQRVDKGKYSNLHNKMCSVDNYSRFKKFSISKIEDK